MSNSIFIIAHAPLASALRECAAHVYACDERVSSRVMSIDVASNADMQSVAESVSAKLPTDPQDPESQRTLILTDLVGATPSNISEALQKYNGGVVVVTGVNLPMVLTALCHQDAPFEDLVERVKAAGLSSINRIPPL